MFTPEMLQQTHQTMKCVLQVIFEYEEDFKRQVLKGCGWEYDSYEIERCHMAEAFRITLKHDDFREKDLYINCNVVYDWFISNQKKVLGDRYER